MTFNKTNYDCKTNFVPEGYENYTNIPEEKKILPPSLVNSVENPIYNEKYKGFVQICEQMEECIEDMIWDDFMKQQELSQFKEEVKKIKNQSIIFAYDEGELSWKI